jgi:type IX secretion system PorP/SprF family membrane protein
MKTLYSKLKGACRDNGRGGVALVLVVLVFLPRFVFAQADVHFSQFYEESILRNPALTGVFADDYKLGVYYRTQWNSITNPYVTSLFSAETHFSVSHTTDDFLSVGLLGYEDKAGSIDQRIAAFYPALNFNKSINSNHNSYLSFGFTGGYVQYSFDPSKATFNNQYIDGNYSPANPSQENLTNSKMTMWDLGAGVNYNTSSGEDNRTTYIVGFSAYHVTQPKFSYYSNSHITENMRLNTNAAMNVTVNDNVTIQFQGNYAMQGTYTEAMAGGMVNVAQSTKNISETLIVSGGVFYRYGDAIIPVVKVRYQRLAMAFSYDVNVSTLKEASNMEGGTEVTLFFTGNYTDKGITRKTVCPKF